MCDAIDDPYTYENSTILVEAMIASFGGDERKLAAIIEGLVG
jgi:hypothetical protein